MGHPAGHLRAVYGPARPQRGAAAARAALGGYAGRGTMTGLPLLAVVLGSGTTTINGNTMTTQPTRIVSIQRATDLLKNGQPLANSCINGELKIEVNDNWNKEVIFDNCIIEYFSAINQQFNKLVKLTNCHFKNCDFTFAYFSDGLLIDNCTFDNYLDFQAGGHNKNGNSITITNNNFKDFVNFFDCWYESEVIISHNAFCKGTNLLGIIHNISVTFDVRPIIEENNGQLDLNNEG